MFKIYILQIFLIFSIKTKYCEKAKTEESKKNCINNFPEDFFDNAWKNFIEMFEKEYNEIENEKRYEVFVRNYKKILLHNIQNRKYQQTVNFFTDLKDDEFERKYLSKIHPKNHDKFVQNKENKILQKKKENKIIEKKEVKKTLVKKEENKILLKKEINSEKKKSLLKNEKILNEDKIINEVFTNVRLGRPISKTKNTKGTGFYSFIKKIQKKFT